MRKILGLLAFIAGFAGTGAHAADVCPLLSNLLADPPAGFIADRAGPADSKHWAGKPVLENAKCRLWASSSAEAHEMRCTVNDRGAPAAVTAYYDDTAKAVDQCLAARPDARTWERRSRTVSVEGLQSTETSWIYNDHVVRFKIVLADDRRSHDGSAYNSFDVEYLKY